MKLTTRELHTLLFAINTACDSEDEFIYCHIQSWDDKPMSGSKTVIKDTKAGIKRMRKLQTKLASELKARREQ